ncbi:MAG: DUF488 domain-containing protein [Blastochloris sp.]|nr:DUF488 domain-containing protein [Blastochloris sp.]
MPTLYTIGFTRLTLAEFVGLLRSAQVDVVVDTRLRNTSQLAGWAKRDDLAFLLHEGFGIAYEHIPPFAPTDELLDAYRTSRDWDSYATAFRSLMIRRDVGTLGRDLFARHLAPCLLCSEPTPEHCHRRLLAEYLSEQISGVEINHLIGSHASSKRKKQRKGL